MTTHSYWLFRWLDAHAITSRALLRKALKSPALVADARALAHADTEAMSRPVDGSSILGGSGMDLSRLVCGTTACRAQLVEHVVAKMWFYFDSVVLPDDVGDGIRTGELRDDQLQEELDRLGGVCLAIRAIGAEGLVCFRTKVVPEWIPSPVQRALPRLAAELRRGAEIRALERNYDTDDTLYGFRSPIVPVVEKLVLHIAFPEMTPDDHISRALAFTLAERHAQLLTSDLRAARTYGLPIGTTVELHRRILRRLGHSVSDSDVALELKFPVLDGMPVRELLRFRDAEYDHFLLFRKRLQELLSAEMKNRARDTGARKVAQAVIRDGIEPELARLRLRMKSARSSLKRTSAFGVSLGALVAGFGSWLGGLAAATSGAVAAVGTAAAAQQKFAERAADANIDAMYFLWRLYEHEHRSG